VGDRQSYLSRQKKKYVSGAEASGRHGAYEVHNETTENDNDMSVANSDRYAL
jgi:hypothetical protein